MSYIDGSVLAQLGSPDMRIPIAYTLAWPERIKTPAKRLDLGNIGSLDFDTPDKKRFPALELARHALRAGGSTSTVLNAANEVAVAAFLSRKIGFLDITGVVEETISKINCSKLTKIDDVYKSDKVGRKTASEIISSNF